MGLEFRLTKAQETALKEADGCPKGVKGKKWLAWANNVLDEADLGQVEVIQPPGPSQHTGAGGAGPSSAAAAGVSVGKGLRSRPYTFQISSGVLVGDGMSINLTGGKLTGSFLVRPAVQVSAQLAVPTHSLVAVAVAVLAA